MTMMISKFHKLIQSRLLWIVFLVAIVFSFVIWGMQWPERGSRDETSPGTLAGKPVPAEEFHAAYLHEYVSMILMFGPQFRSNDEIESHLQEAAWRRLIGWREADRLGVRVSDGEVLRAIREEPAFQENGAFSLDRYRTVLASLLSGMRLDERYFEEFLRGELKTRKLADLLNLATVVTPAERKTLEAEYTTVVRAEYVAVPPEAVAEGVSVTDDDARRIYDRDPSAYRIPPRVRLRYVRFDGARHRDEIGEFTEEATEDYYAVHRREFQRFDFSVAEDGEPRPGRPVTPPLEDIREEVVERMTEEAARARARSEADQFIRRIAPYATARPVPFEEAAEDAGLEVRTAPPVARGERIPGTNAPRSATEAAFTLQPTPDEFFTEPFSSRDDVYIFALDERIPAEIPDFDAVRDQALADAKAERIQEAQHALMETIQQRLNAGEALEEIAAEREIVYRTTALFTPASGPEEPELRPLRFPLSGLNEGEVTPPVSAPDGRLLLARLLERRPGEPDEREERVPDFDEWRTQKANLVFHTWLEGLLERDGFEARSRSHPDDADVPAG